MAALRDSHATLLFGLLRYQQFQHGQADLREVLGPDAGEAGRARVVGALGDRGALEVDRGGQRVGVV